LQNSLFEDFKKPQSKNQNKSKYTQNNLGNVCESISQQGNYEQQCQLEMKFDSKYRKNL